MTLNKVNGFNLLDQFLSMIYRYKAGKFIQKKLA